MAQRTAQLDARRSAEQFLRAVVGAWAWRIALAALLNRLSALVAGGLILALCIVVADHVVPDGLPRPLIAAVGIGSLAALLATALATLIRAIRARVNPAFAARAAERAREIPHNLLLSAVTLSEVDAAAYARPAAVAQASAALDASAERSGGLLSWRGLAWPATAALACILYALVASKPVLPSLMRMLGWDLAAPTATRIERVRPAAHEIVYAGRPLALEFRVAGRAARDFVFELVSADGSIGQRQTPGRAPGSEADLRRVSLAAHEVAGALHIRCRAGDGLLDETLTVHEPPRAVQTIVELTPPAYLGDAPRTIIDGDVHAWFGTRARLTIRAAGEIREPLLVLQSRDETRTRMNVASDDPRSASVGLHLTESGEYWVTFADIYGAPVAQPVRRRIVVRDDAAPSVRVTEPTAARGEPIDVSRVARLAALASDDVALGSIWLVQELAGQTQRTELTRGAAPLGASQEMAFPLARLDLGVGRTTRVWFEASDRRHLLDGTFAPQTGASPVLTITRSSPEIAKADLPEEGAPGIDSAGGEGNAGGERGTGLVPGRGSAAKTGEGGQGGPGSGAGGADSAEGGHAGGDDGSAGAGSPKRGDGGDPNSPAPGGDSSGGGEFEQALRDFVKKHGAAAREAKRGERAGEQESGGGGQAGHGESTGASGAANERRDAGEAESDEDQPAPESQPAESAPEPQPPTAQDDSKPPAAPATQPSPDKPERDAGAPPTATAPAPEPEQAGDPDNADPPAKPEMRPPDEVEPDGPRPASPQPDPAAPPSEKPDDPSASQPTDAPERDRPPVNRGDPTQPADAPAVIDAPDDAATSPENAADAGAGPDAGELRGSPALARRGEFVDVLDLLRRGEPPREADLIALGWSEDRRREFVKDFERLRSSAQKAGVIGPMGEWLGSALLGSDEVERGGRGAAGLVTRVERAESLSDGLQQLAQPRDETVPASLRPVLDAYYRALAKRRAATTRPAE